MTKPLNIRVERHLKQAVHDIAGPDSTYSETANKLIKIGIAVRDEGVEPKITGPLGAPRPFAEIGRSTDMTELRTNLDQDTIDKLTDLFDDKPNTAARQALRLGVYKIYGDEIKIEGLAGLPRPFAEIQMEDLEDPEAHDLVEELQKHI